MNFRPLVAAMTAGSLLLCSFGAFAQAEAQQWQNERQNRGAERGGPYAPQPGNPTAQRNYICAVIAHMVESGVGAWTPNAKAFCASSG